MFPLPTRHRKLLKNMFPSLEDPPPLQLLYFPRPRPYFSVPPFAKGRPEDVLRHIRAELGRLVRRTNDSQMRPAALRAFESLDRNGTGRVSRRDFRRALSELGFNRLGDEEAADILDYFDPHR